MDKIIDRIVTNLSVKDFRGIDPYDFASSKVNLPSQLISKLSFLNKISPINFRKALGIVDSYNSKSNALFLQALCIYDPIKFSTEIDYLINWLIENRSIEFEEYSVGFAFEMALSRYQSGPGKTSLIISLFTMFAFFEAYKNSGNKKLLDCIISFEELLSSKWLKFEDDYTLWFSYLPNQKDEVYNATAKVGRFYALYYKIFPSEDLKNKLLKILNYLVSVQNPDGSWGYSVKNPYVDNFHTVFMLESIYHMHEVVNTDKSNLMFESALADYITNCFIGPRPLHFHTMHYPKDIRSKLIDTEIRDIANAIILFSKIGQIDRAETILNWAVSNYYDSKDGYFYFFQNRIYKSKINYVRWQGWMSLAIAEFSKHK
ncbi:prenyltransferase/squalene oxidase repeat-containing protein [Algoriphagus machipongonensis]|uniref:Uncharacterized protein n=1 Tax=Algoriphagus machipongonensis TaxID=388413 RepID=A3HRR5_9BACT|nr:hypothetical protein [Algoriphagus machipongonensis]EAZ82533.1 hypothetical protein ALPR1_09970 [Algoriphagus machipongonensis]